MRDPVAGVQEAARYVPRWHQAVSCCNSSVTAKYSSFGYVSMTRSRLLINARVSNGLPECRLGRVKGAACAALTCNRMLTTGHFTLDCYERGEMPCCLSYGHGCLVRREPAEMA